MKSLRELESVGWGFFLAMLALSAGPCIYLVWRITSNDAPAVERAILGLALAALVAAVLSWAVNDWLFRRMVREHEADKKTETRKGKKKKRR